MDRNTESLPDADGIRPPAFCVMPISRSGGAWCFGLRRWVSFL